MKEWFSASELAGLPGLPTTDRRVREYAKRNDWSARPRNKGKGLEYHIGSLPSETRAEIGAQNVKKKTADPVKAGSSAGRKAAVRSVMQNKCDRIGREKGLSTYLNLDEMSHYP